MSSVMIEAIIFELSYEVQTLKKHFERIPDSLFTYAPHKKSMQMGTLAAHCIETMGWIDGMLLVNEFHFDPSQYVSPKAESQAALMSLTDSLLQHAIETLRKVDDDCLMQNWKMIVGGETKLQMPKIAVLRSFVLSHMIHHRGQLTVYMRMNDLPLPSTYGPTADESGF